MAQSKTRAAKAAPKRKRRAVTASTPTTTSKRPRAATARAPSRARALSFADYLTRFTALMAKHGGALELRSPAKPNALGKLDALSGVRVPDELRAAWQTTDGCARHLFSRPGFLTGYQFLGLSEAIKQRAGFATRAPRYAGYQEDEPRDPRIAPGWYQPGWLPFAAFGGATLVLLVDSSPTSRGRPGQIIAFTHDPDEITYVAASFSEFLAASLRWTDANAEDILDLD